MSRREYREHLFRMLFLKDFHDPSEIDDQIEMYFESIVDPKQEELNNLKLRYDSILEKMVEIDQVIEESASGWKLIRMGKIDLTIIRLATFEVLFDDDIPTGVAINEAVEIAKIFGEDNSPGFINGILAKIVNK